MSDKVKEFPSIVQMMDDGLQKEIDRETELWNKCGFKGTELDRYPLSPSQIGKCGLALGRNLAHYLDLAPYLRDPTSLKPRTKRIFNRGSLLEDALIRDMERYTPLRVEQRQLRVTLFELESGDKTVPIQGNIDGIIVHPDGTRVLVDYKSKGSYYSSAFTDSISEFFQEMKQTGKVEELTPNAFMITDPAGLFQLLSMDEFFVDYLLQLNSYAFSKELNGTIDFVSLYYENKNTCANYEVRWKPHPELFEFARRKYQYIYDTVTQKGPEAIQKEFSLGSARCRLCDYNELCWGKFTPPGKNDRVIGRMENPDRVAKFKLGVTSGMEYEKLQGEILAHMENMGWTHIQIEGSLYERKFLKSPKPHFELRLSK